MTFASRLEFLAAKATKGEWVADAVFPHVKVWFRMDDGARTNTYSFAPCDNDDAQYIAFLNPSVGLAVARALRAAEASLKFGSHDGACIFDEDDASSPCSLHVEANERRASDLRAALAALEATEEADAAKERFHE